MRISPRLWVCALLPVLLAGCTSTITNLTPKQHARSRAGVYPLEVRWDCNQRSLRRETIRPYVVVGTNFFPMQRTALVSNRWEALVPAPADRRFVSYRFKFDYEYHSIPRPRRDSRLSPPYQLEIVDQ